MGYFTFTFADKKLRKNKDGEYSKTCKLGYNGRNAGYIAFPDGTFSEPETCYFGYGFIAGYEVYELVAEWNRPYLEEILKAIQEKDGKYFVTDKILAIGTAWQNGDQKTINQLLAEEEDNCLTPLKEWKRTIGIAIVHANNAKKIRYPLKIVSSKKKKYEELPASKPAQ